MAQPQEVPEKDVASKSEPAHEYHRILFTLGCGVVVLVGVYLVLRGWRGRTRGDAARDIFAREHMVRRAVRPKLVKIEDADEEKEEANDVPAEKPANEPDTKNQPSPIDTTRSSSTASPTQLTPPAQFDTLDTTAQGAYTPRVGPLNDFSLQQTYDAILAGDLVIDPKVLIVSEEDEWYYVLRLLTPVQRALLSTRDGAHQERVIEGLRDDMEGDEAWSISGEELLQEIMRKAE